MTTKAQELAREAVRAGKAEQWRDFAEIIERTIAPVIAAQEEEIERLRAECHRLTEANRHLSEELLSAEAERDEARAKLAEAEKGPSKCGKVIDCGCGEPNHVDCGIASCQTCYQAPASRDGGGWALLKESEGRLAKAIAEGELVQMYYRRRVWMNHGCDPCAVYGDDGEMQCNALGCRMDFRRTSIQEIERVLMERAWKKVAEAEKAMRQLGGDCGLCHHTLEGNRHGFDQNDVYMDADGRFVHSGRCTYCAVCRLPPPDPKPATSEPAE